MCRKLFMVMHMQGLWESCCNAQHTVRRFVKCTQFSYSLFLFLTVFASTSSGLQQSPLQVVQRMAQHGPTSDAVELLQRTCHQVQAEAQPGSGGHPAMSEGYGSRGMMPMPEDSFAGPSSSLPQPSFANAHMFSGTPYCMAFMLHECMQAVCMTCWSATKGSLTVTGKLAQNSICENASLCSR